MIYDIYYNYTHFQNGKTFSNIFQVVFQHTLMLLKAKVSINSFIVNRVKPFINTISKLMKEYYKII